MSRNLPLPFFAVAPDEYDALYHDEITRSFATFLRNSQNPGVGRHSALTLTALQTDDSYLETGALFEVGGFVKIAKLDSPHVRGLSGTGGVGTVTVSLP